MTIGEKKDLLKKYYSHEKFIKFFTEDCETITSIDLEDEIVYFTVYVTSSCGCCSEVEYLERDLTIFLEFLSESDFKELIDILKG